MDLMDRVAQLVEVMRENDLAEIEIQERDLRIKLRRSQPVQYLPAGVSPSFLQQGAAVHPALAPAEGAAEGLAPAKQEDLAEITSPMVGTFYRASGAGAEPYVTFGSVVEADTVVCIIEAMKVMNEIKAEVCGEIVEILVQDAEPVEFGQVLFLVRPSEE